MPIYEFKCLKCDHAFEILFRNREKMETVLCPACQSAKTQRQMSAFAGRVGNTSAGGASCGSCSAASCPPS